jgi:ABC-type spermidine/putrescine transport system permease subunit I
MLGVPTLEGRLLYTEAAVFIGVMQIMLPFAVIPLYASLRQIDPSVIRAAASLGATPVQQWARVILPLTATAAIAAWLLVLLLTIGLYLTPAILGGPRSLMMTTLIGREVAGFNLPFASLLSIALIAVTAALLVIFRIGASRASRRGLLWGEL